MTVLEEQGFLDTPEGREKIIALLPNEGLQQQMRDLWAANRPLSGRQRWATLVSTVLAMKKVRRRARGAPRTASGQHATTCGDAAIRAEC